jgi:dipeptidyl-peptidase-4
MQTFSERTLWRIVVVLFSLTLSVTLAVAQNQSASTGTIKRLTVERIYSQPSLSGHLLRGLQWSPDSTQLSFFEEFGAGREAKTSLAAMNAKTGERRTLIPAEQLAAILPAQTSSASQATGLGRRPPSEYQWAPDGLALLFTGARALAWFDLKSDSSRVLLSSEEPIADAKISPDGKSVSFVRDHNLFAVEVANGKERAITSGGTEEVRKGELDWVYPEELGITTAYWWSPDSSSIAYLQMDERKVAQYPIVDFESYTGKAELQRYPVPGTPNPVVHIYVVSANGGSPRLMETGSELDQYLPRVDWLRDSKRVAIQRLNRPQTQLDLLVADAKTGKSRVVLTEKDQYWINVGDELRFLSDNQRFLWSSERSGYRHLYLYNLDGTQVAQVTKGEWEVTGVNAIDEAGNSVYYTATEKSPLERHVYRVGLDGSGFARITKADGTHAATFSKDAKTLFETFSDTATLPQQNLLRADGTLVAAINENKVPELAEYHLSPVEFLTVRSHDGVSLNAMMIKPPDFNPVQKYPVLVYTYGGPHAQVVRNGWGGANYLWHELMAQHGFIIFALDNRGSAGRGHLFEEYIHYRFGAQELSDQRDGVAWLKMQPYVDADRIGIWGWSYGGHMTLHAMFEDPEEFKVGFAGAPVSDWHYYDTVYTERYIGLLPQNAQSYKESSPVENAEKLRGKLLIAHGTGDDNVHFANTLDVLQDLIAAGKSIEVMPFPGRGHGIPDPPARRVLMRRVTQFFLDNLGSAGQSQSAN